MSRKHFIEMARTINEQRQEIVEGFMDGPEKELALDILFSSTSRLAATFGGFNDNFDYQRFLTACGF